MSWSTRYLLLSFSLRLTTILVRVPWSNRTNWVNICIWDLPEWLICCDLGIPNNGGLTLERLKAWLIPWIWCLSSTAWHWGPGGFLETLPVLSPQWKHDEAGSWYQWRMTQQHRGRCTYLERRQQTESQGFLLALFIRGCHWEVPPMFSLDLLTSNNLIKNITDVPCGLPSGWLQISWQPGF